MKGTWQTTDSDGGAAAWVALAVIVAVAVAGAVKGAAIAAGEIAVIGVAVAAGLTAGAVIMYAVVRARGRRRAAPRTDVQLWHANPQALPPREPRAIAPAPVVNVNIDAGLLAGLLAEAQRQQAPVIVPSQAEELSR